MRRVRGSVQGACEQLEEVLDRWKDIKHASYVRLTDRDFLAINTLLFEMQVSGKYELPEEQDEGE